MLFFSHKLISKSVLFDFSIINYEIILDKKYKYEDLKKILSQHGGYYILYNGRVVRKDKNKINYEEVDSIFDKLHYFLSFFNGQPISALFLKGFTAQKEVWCDYTCYNVKPYKNVSYLRGLDNVKDRNKEGEEWRHVLSCLWTNYMELCKDPTTADFLEWTITWYTQTNNDFVETSIIVAQTALELIYNWYVVEKRKIIKGRDSENLSAANKIRLLISQFNINTAVPSACKELQKAINGFDKTMDAPDGVVFIRNALVHSQESKREKLKKISFQAKYDALKICRWYIELCLLAILGYNGKYMNRCSDKSCLEFVPWYQDSSHPD